MDLSQLPEEVGCWKREKILGAGGFGYVVLWRNKENNETIALKQCRWGHDSMMTPRHRDYWKKEVNIMGRLQHPNVVRALRVPAELDVQSVTDLPILAMEYCSRGDLRKLLNKPENCCGLSEKCVRLLLRHVSSAVNYLHSERIIHRDLKPENIVIQDTNGSMVFKLIDLGYAKELDQGSLCTSFVGTLQYLAPELFMSQKYSCTVDYWSLGLVTHEVITGLRPFLPDKSPAEWIPIIRKKTSSQIRAYLNVDKNIEFSEEIAPHHHICSVLKEDIESWLQLMLEYDARKRGRCEDASAFSYLMKILDKKVLSVFCVNTCKLLSLPYDEAQSLEDFKNSLELQSGIPAHEQEILLPNGASPSAHKGTSQLLCQSEDDVGAFLFSKNVQTSSATESTVIPAGVEAMMRDPCTKMKYDDQRALWLIAVFLSQQESLLVSRLIQAYKANLMHLITKSSHCRKSTSNMISDMNKVSAKSLFLKSSLEQDLHSYRKQAENGGFTSQEMYEGWKSSSENLKKLEVLKNRVSVLERASSSMEARILELQKMPYARSRSVCPMEEVHNKVLEAYAELKKRSKEQRHKPHDNTDIVRLLCLCLQQSRSCVQDILLLIRTTNEIRQECERSVVPQVENILHEIREWDTQIGVWQSKRQAELWRVIDALNHKIQSLEKSSPPLYLPSSLQESPLATSESWMSNGHPTSLQRYVVNFQTFANSTTPATMPRSKIIMPPVIVAKNRIEPLTGGSAYLEEEPDRSRFATLQSSLDTLPLSSFVEKTVEESNRVLKENENLLESFQQMIHVLRSDQQGKESPEANQNESDFMQ